MTVGIIILTILVSLLAFRDPSTAARLRFSPWLIREKGQAYRFITYALVHADWVHLGVNMFVLYSFGRATEFYYAALFPGKGLFYFILLYLGGILFSVVADHARHQGDPSYAAVGASGAVSAVVFASIVIHPMNGVMIFPIPFEIPGILFGVLYLAYSAYMARKGGDHIGHNAHFWGAVYGAALTIALKPALVGRMLEEIIS